MSTTTFAGALLYGLMQWQLMGSGLKTINGCYLPLSLQVSQNLSPPMEQLDKEFDRIAREGAVSLRPTNARLHLIRIEKVLKNLRWKIRKLHGNYPQEKEKLYAVSKTIESAESQIKGYQAELINWEKGNLKIY